MTRTFISMLYLIATCTSSALLPLVGKALDRAGPRAMVTITALALAITCIFMAAVQGPLALGVCFFFLRFLGAWRAGEGGSGGSVVPSGVVCEALFGPASVC